MLGVVLAGWFVEECMMIETSALTERSTRERHVLILAHHGHVVASRCARNSWTLSTRCCSSSCVSLRGWFDRGVIVVLYLPSPLCPHSKFLSYTMQAPCTLLTTPFFHSHHCGALDEAHNHTIHCPHSPGSSLAPAATPEAHPPAVQDQTEGCVKHHEHLRRPRNKHHPQCVR